MLLTTTHETRCSDADPLPPQWDCWEALFCGTALGSASAAFGKPPFRAEIAKFSPDLLPSRPSQLLTIFAAAPPQVCTIHSPTSQSFRLFAKLYLLADGRTVFFGDPHAAAIPHFEKCGFQFQVGDEGVV